MAKSEKKISIASLDKVLKEQAVDIATEQWFGNEVKIKHTLFLGGAGICGRCGVKLLSYGWWLYARVAGVRCKEQHLDSLRQLQPSR